MLSRWRHGWLAALTSLHFELAIANNGLCFSMHIHSAMAYHWHYARACRLMAFPFVHDAVNFLRVALKTRAWLSSCRLPHSRSCWQTGGHTVSNPQRLRLQIYLPPGGCVSLWRRLVHFAHNFAILRHEYLCDFLGLQAPATYVQMQADEDDKDEMATAAETFCMRLNFEQCGNKHERKPTCFAVK